MTGIEEDQLATVSFLDPLPYTKLPSLYKSVDAFVMATHGEGWGLPIIEAMAMELPAISTFWSGSTGEKCLNFTLKQKFIKK